MAPKTKYRADDLATVVWLNQTGPLVLAGEMTWEEAASEAWAMEADKADRTRILIGLFEDEIRGAWAVRGAEHHVAVPEGKKRKVNRSTFTLAEDPRLRYLVGAPSPLGSRRNPQTTIELRDLPGASTLIDEAELASHGVVQLGQFTLLVSMEGAAEVRMPTDATLTIRTVSTV
jgi:hypothetical protein